MAIHPAMADVVAQVTASFGCDPAEINRGRCDEWANAVAALVGGYGLWLDTIWDGVAHYVLVLDGRFYDAEHPNGVDDIAHWAPKSRAHKEKS